MTRLAVPAFLLPILLLLTPLSPAQPGAAEPAATPIQAEEASEEDGSIPRHATNPYQRQPEATDAERARAERRRQVLVGFSLATFVLVGILVMTVRRGPRKH